MCRCCRLCWEDFYWMCIEERFCYDETIVDYKPEEDEYYMKKHAANGSLPSYGLQPPDIIRHTERITTQPRPQSLNLTNDSNRVIQMNAPVLAPEIIAAFANSQIFNDHPSSKISSPVSPLSPVESIHKFRSKAALKDEKEQKNYKTFVPEKKIEQESKSRTDLSPKFQISVESDSPEDSPVILRKSVPDTVKEEDTFKSEVDSIGATATSTPKTINKYLQVEAPYFSTRPASENDLFSMTQPADVSRFSMTPEVPSVSFATLPKNYADTPVMGDYRESKSLYEIQTAGIKEEDMSMPRFYTKSLLNSTTVTLSNDAVNTSQSKQQRIEKSKRLRNIRRNIAPLTISNTSIDRAKDDVAQKGDEATYQSLTAFFKRSKENKIHGSLEEREILLPRLHAVKMLDRHRLSLG